MSPPFYVYFVVTLYHSFVEYEIIVLVSLNHCTLQSREEEKEEEEEEWEENR